MIRVKTVENQAEMDQVFEIREKVFIEEQECSRDEEFDGYDDESVHFIAYYDGKPAGTSRYRRTDKGIKLERFAVYQEFRGKGVGKRLVQSSVGHIEATIKEPGLLLYLHAQLMAIPLYARHGFQKIGEKFVEAQIEHFEMRKKLA